VLTLTKYDGETETRRAFVRSINPCIDSLPRSIVAAPSRSTAARRYSAASGSIRPSCSGTTASSPACHAAFTASSRRRSTRGSSAASANARGGAMALDQASRQFAVQLDRWLQLMVDQERGRVHFPSVDGSRDR